MLKPWINSPLCLSLFKEDKCEKDRCVRFDIRRKTKEIFDVEELRDELILNNIIIKSSLNCKKR